MEADFLPASAGQGKGTGASRRRAIHRSRHRSSQLSQVVEKTSGQHGRQTRRTTLLARAIARDPSPRLRLHHPIRVHAQRRHQQAHGNHKQRRAVRQRRRRPFKRAMRPNHRASGRQNHSHAAMVRAASPAAGRQACLGRSTLRRYSQQQGHAEKHQQNEAEELLHVSGSSLHPPANHRRRNNTGENVTAPATNKTNPRMGSVWRTANTGHAARIQNAMFAEAARYTQSENRC